MLQIMRTAAKSWVSKGLFLVLVGSFGLWGINDIFTSNPRSKPIARVGGEEIPRRFIESQYKQELQRIRSLTQDAPPAELARRFGVLDSIVAQTVEKTIFERAADDLGLKISDARFIDQMRTTPGMTDEQGKFQPQRLRQALSQIGLSEAAFIDIQKKEIARVDLVGALTASPPLPALLLTHSYLASQEQRTADILLIDAKTAYADIAAPDDVTLTAFYDSRKAQFEQPEYRALTLLHLSLADIAKKLTVTDAELRTSYDERAADFNKPQRRTLDQQVFQTKDEALQAAAAARKSGQLKNAVRLDDVTAADLLPSLQALVFALDKGDISDPIQTDLGWHVVQVKSITKSGNRSFEDVRAEIKTQLQQDKAVAELASLQNKVEDALAGGASLEETAKQFDLPIRKTGPLNASGADKTGKRDTATNVDTKLLREAFTLPEGQESNLIATSGEDLWIVRVDAVTQAAAPPLADIKADVVRVWQDQERTQKAKAEAEALMTQLKNGATLDSLTKGRKGFRSLTTSALSRQASSQDYPAPLVSKIFAARIGDAVQVETPSGIALARVKTIRAADTTGLADAEKTLTPRVRQDVSEDLMQQFSAALRQVYPVKINHDIIDQMYGTAGE
jgi:peptidyl-prolyl cis-trans isomerase D